VIDMIRGVPSSVGLHSGPGQCWVGERSQTSHMA